MSEITSLTVHELQQKLKRKELTIAEILESYCNRINEKEPEVEAFVTTYLEEAKAEAQKVQEKLDNGEDLGEYAGILTDLLQTVGVGITPPPPQG